MRFLLICFGLAVFTVSGCGGGGSGSGTTPAPIPKAAGISISTSALSFNATENGNAPDFQDVNAVWSGSSVSTVEAQETNGHDIPDWLRITKFGTGTELTFEFLPIRTDMAASTYNSKIDIVAKNSAGTVLASKSVDVTYVIEPEAGGGGAPNPDAAANRATQDEIFHFGQEIILNGANVAWSAEAGNWYNNDIGATDGSGAPRTNISAFQTHFETIANAGGNSARIWLHTASTVTPAIQNDGTVSGLSHVLTNAQVIDQLTLILDAAWDEGILVTFNLFSFNMLCDQNRPGPAKDMIENHLQTYIDNALEPMVLGVKDHPAMFAWDVFNEPEGVTQTDYFCPSTEIYTYETLQTTVNQLAAAIHDTDPNVKVTMSTHTDLYDRFSNETLLDAPGAVEGGTLDFYSLHWYDTGWQVSPHVTAAGEFNADRPIVAGEYDVQGTGAGGPAGRDTVSNLLSTGYAGAWPWSLTTGNVSLIAEAISNGSAQSTAVDKTAIETCIQDKPIDCYNP